jgi:hypothetical protein
MNDIIAIASMAMPAQTRRRRRSEIEARIEQLQQRRAQIALRVGVAAVTSGESIVSNDELRVLREERLEIERELPELYSGLTVLRDMERAARAAGRK